MTHSTSRRLIGIMFRPACQILILIGLATLLLSVVTIWQYQASTRRTKETNARVISVNKITGIGDDERGRNNQACQVDYRFRIKGDEYTAILGYRGEPTTDKCRLHSGQSVKIKYDPNHPANNAYLPDHQNSGKKTLRQTIFASGSIAATGIVPIIIGMVGLRIAKHRHTERWLSRISASHGEDWDPKPQTDDTTNQTKHDAKPTDQTGTEAAKPKIGKAKKSTRTTPKSGSKSNKKST